MSTSEAKRSYMDIVKRELKQEVKQEVERPNGSQSLLKRVKRDFLEETDPVLREAKKRIGRFIFENGVDFDAVESPSFEDMISSYDGTNFTHIPMPEELRGWIFNDAVKEMIDYVNEIRNSWAQTGCSILLDGWKDTNGRTLVNVLVNCPKGTVYLGSFDITDYIDHIDAMGSFLDHVIADVGKENVVQIITYSSSTFMKQLGEKLKEKYRSIFWTVGASYCIEIMLEKFGAMDLVKEVFEKSYIITRFVQNGNGLVPPSKLKSTLPFLTLENIVLEKENLKNMSHLYDFNLTVEGRRVIELVEDQSFWHAATTVVKATIPLVRVMELINENKANMGFIYETIDQAKETIKTGLQNKRFQYMPFWNVIDDVWDRYLHNALHASGYFFNPSFFYSSDGYMDPEIASGLVSCVARASEDLRIVDLICEQLENYRKAKGAFGVGCAIDKRSNVPPALWWSTYGAECPELQRLAIRILSQTCNNASMFMLPRSLAETLLTEGRNSIEQQRLRDRVFLSYNLKLRNRVSGIRVRSGATNAA